MEVGESPLCYPLLPFSLSVLRRQAGRNRRGSWGLSDRLTDLGLSFSLSYLLRFNCSLLSIASFTLDLNIGSRPRVPVWSTSLHDIRHHASIALAFTLALASGLPLSHCTDNHPEMIQLQSQEQESHVQSLGDELEHLTQQLEETSRQLEDVRWERDEAKREKEEVRRRLGEEVRGLNEGIAGMQVGPLKLRRLQIENVVIIRELIMGTQFVHDRTRSSR